MLFGLFLSVIGGEFFFDHIADRRLGLFGLLFLFLGFLFRGFLFRFLPGFFIGLVFGGSELFRNDETDILGA